MFHIEMKLFSNKRGEMDWEQPVGPYEARKLSSTFLSRRRQINLL